MKLEEVQERLAVVEKSLQQCIANYNLLEGAKQECLYWLEKLKVVEPDTEHDKEPDKESDKLSDSQMENIG